MIARGSGARGSDWENLTGETWFFSHFTCFRHSTRANSDKVVFIPPIRCTQTTFAWQNNCFTSQTKNFILTHHHGLILLHSGSKRREHPSLMIDVISKPEPEEINKRLLARVTSSRSVLKTAQCQMFYFIAGDLTCIATMFQLLAEVGHCKMHEERSRRFSLKSRQIGGSTLPHMSSTQTSSRRRRNRCPWCHLM